MYIFRHTGQAHRKARKGITQTQTQNTWIALKNGGLLAPTTWKKLVGVHRYPRIQAQPRQENLQTDEVEERKGQFKGNPRKGLARLWAIFQLRTDNWESNKVHKVTKPLTLIMNLSCDHLYFEITFIVSWNTKTCHYSRAFSLSLKLRQINLISQHNQQIQTRISFFLWFAWHLQFSSSMIGDEDSSTSKFLEIYLQGYGRHQRIALERLNKRPKRKVKRLADRNNNIRANQHSVSSRVKKPLYNQSCNQDGRAQGQARNRLCSSRRWLSRKKKTLK